MGNLFSSSCSLPKISIPNIKNPFKKKPNKWQEIIDKYGDPEDHTDSGRLSPLIVASPNELEMGNSKEWEG